MAKKTDKADGEKPLPEGLRAADMKANEPLAEFETGTLSGDVRDVILMHMRDMRVPWSMLGEDEQQDKINAAKSCGEDVVRRCVQAVLKTGFKSVIVQIGPIKIDKDIEVKVHASPIALNVELLAAHGKQSAVLILAEAADYFGERAPQKPQKDQPDLPLDPPVANA
jgi:hypothetical protein